MAQMSKKRALCVKNETITDDTPKYDASPYAMMFMVTVINQDAYKCAYGRQYRKKTLLRHRIKLPVTPAGTPDWQFMEQYIKSLPYSANL